jgi:hypothetical protein
MLLQCRQTNRVCGSWKGALQTFVRVIEVLKVGLVDDEDHEVSPGDTSTPSIATSNMCQEWHNIPDIVWPYSSTSSSSPIGNHQHNDRDTRRTSSFHQCLIIEEVAQEDVARNYDCSASELIPALLYNFGLSSHLIGIERGSREYLRQACCLYDLALEALMARQQEVGGNEGRNTSNIGSITVTAELPLSMTPVLALLNNKGQIEHNLQEVQQTFVLLVEEWGLMKRVSGGDIQGCSS